MGLIIGAAVGALFGMLLGSVFGVKYGTEGKASGKADPEDLETYKEYIEKGKFLILVHGPEEEVKRGHEILVEESNPEHIVNIGLIG